MNLSDLLGLRSRIRRLRILAGETALAAEDRAQLLRLAWEEEKKRLRLMLGLGGVIIGLTTVAIALLSMAVVVHFWDTPYRGLAAWLLALLWVGLWVAAVLMLVNTLSGASGFASARQTFERDLAWFHERFGLEAGDGATGPLAALSSEQLMARIERQRRRVATLDAAASGAGEAPLPTTPSVAAVAVGLARQHPIATGVAAAAVVAVIGPRRLVRWATVVAPVLWRLRG